jgi:Tol biopolymer transport system component
MDFGLAKAASPVVSSSALSATLTSPTQHHPLTAEGTVVGTFQYMSPEQVEAKDADARSDIFALGAVLYEMITGKRAFEGKTAASTIAAILAAEPPPVSTLQPMSPPALDRTVKACLAKDPEERLQTAHDVKLQLSWIADGISQPGLPAQVSGQRKNREAAAWIAAGVVVLAALAMAVIHLRDRAPQGVVVRSAILPPEKGAFVFLGPIQTAFLSPDGRNIAFLARVGGVTQLWVRPLNSFTSRPLAGTEEAYGAFWSADSRNLGFFAEGKIKRVAATGGPVLTLCEVDQARGGSWNRQDVIIFAKFPGEVYRVPASGGTPEPATHFDPARHDTTHRWPYFLPDGNHFVYMASSLGVASDDNVFYLSSLDGKVNRILFHGSSPLAYASGSLLYLVDGTLMARPFDTGKLDFVGEPVAVAEGVQFDPIYSNGVFSVSENGVLLYQIGSASTARTILLYDPNGKPLGSLGEPAPYAGPRVSPDGKRVAYTLIDAKSGKSDIWIHDLASGNRTRLTVDPVRSYTPVWSRDGTQVAYTSARSGKPLIYVKSVSGMGMEQKIWETAILGVPNDWTLDSKMVIAQERSPSTGRSRLILLPADGKGGPTTLLEQQTASVSAGQISADGRWIAYQCDESGKYEVYVSTFPKPTGRLQISTAGGHYASWRRDGKELYYLAPDGNLIAAELKETNGLLQVVALRRLFQTKANSLNDSYDAFPDGKKFLVSTVAKEETPTPLSLVFNWTAELKK